MQNYVQSKCDMTLFKHLEYVEVNTLASKHVSFVWLFQYILFVLLINTMRIQYIIQSFCAQNVLKTDVLGQR